MIMGLSKSGVSILGLIITLIAKSHDPLSMWEAYG